MHFRYLELQCGTDKFCPIFLVIIMPINGKILWASHYVYVLQTYTCTHTCTRQHQFYLSYPFTNHKHTHPQCHTRGDDENNYTHVFLDVPHPIPIPIPPRLSRLWACTGWVGGFKNTQITRVHKRDRKGEREAGRRERLSEKEETGRQERGGGNGEIVLCWGCHDSNMPAGGG